MSSKKPATVGSLRCGIAIVTLLLSVALSASAQTLTVIHSFDGQDGVSPVGVTTDAAGDLYGATYTGGGGGVLTNHGVVFKLAHQDTGWVFTVLHRFNGLDGAGAEARPVMGPDGALYGTTSYGGDGYGVVYRLQPPASCRSGNCPWTETVLYSFQGGSDGADPATGDLAFDQQGNVYGTAVSGGSCNGYCGVVFKLTRSGRSWSYSVIYSFQGGNDGQNPDGGVFVDASGNLYGTAIAGGYYLNGVVFELTPSGSGWTETTILAFPADGSLGSAPESGLLTDSYGTLYGTTTRGGQYGAGTLFYFNPIYGGGGVASLPSMTGGSYSKPAIDGAGNLYCTTYLGYILELTYSDDGWVVTQLGETDPALTSSVAVDSNGVVYGTDPGGENNPGSVFEITQ
jgi:uncharacterized repeat protein (TIGR03803 family)